MEFSKHNNQQMLPFVGCIPYRGVGYLGVFPLFLNRVADILAPKRSIIFRGLIHHRIISGVLAVR